MSELQVGKVYRAQKPRAAGGVFDSFVNDRQIVWIGSCSTQVQYDSPSVKTGQKLPTVSIEKFMKWMGGEINDVTDQLPNGEWASWDEYKESK